MRRAIRLDFSIERWPLAVPFRITGHEFRVIEVIVVTLERDGCVGKGEAIGVYYRSETASTMARQLESVRREIESGIDRESLQLLLPPGGTRNALDCALWDLEARLNGCAVWELAGIETPRPLLTMFTCGADAPDRMAEVARSYVSARTIKIKLTGELIDADRVRAVRSARTDVEIVVDANQGFSRVSLERLMPVLVEARVTLIEQPFPVGCEAFLDEFGSPLPIAADESAQCLDDVPGLVGRFDVLNIKLDKCGGLTEALSMARAARRLGLRTWVGNMIGTSLAMAPAFVAGQLCDFVELDGPLFLQSDRPRPIRYFDGMAMCSEGLWGGESKKCKNKIE